MVVTLVDGNEEARRLEETGDAQQIPTPLPAPDDEGDVAWAHG